MVSISTIWNIRNTIDPKQPQRLLLLCQNYIVAPIGQIYEHISFMYEIEFSLVHEGIIINEHVLRHNNPYFYKIEKNELNRHSRSNRHEVECSS